jgi:UDP-glucuronate decarboxylase
VNLGNPEEFTIKELANIVLDLTGSKSEMIFKELPMDDPIQRKPDISLAREKLNNWEPGVKLKSGLTKTIEYFDNLLKEN